MCGCGPISGRCSRIAIAVALALGFLLPHGVVADDDSEKLDAEQELIAHRRARLSQLPPLKAPPEVSQPTFNPIDQFVAASWPKDQRGAPQLCDDATFLRRVYLDVIGVIPTPNETNRFLASAGGQAKRDKLVDQLLARNEDYAAHWTTFWEDALASQNVRAQGGILTRGNYRDWLLESFAHNRPFDVMVAELIDPAMPGRKRAETEDVLGSKFTIEYVRNEDHTATLQTAANVAQVFLATSMKCASCHDHFENDEWPQERFLAFAGMFAEKDLEKIRCELKTGVHVPANVPFALADLPQEVPQDLQGRLQLAARWLTDPANPRFAKSIVNRLWKRYFGLGLFEPADDFRLDVAPSHPELLDWLARDFLEHDCDLKHTTRLLLTSRTYQLRYDPVLQDAPPSRGDTKPRYFRSPALRRLTAEQFLDSVRTAANGKFVPAERTFLDNRSTALARALGRPASRNEISTARPDDVAVVQALELANGPELQTMIYANPLALDSGRKGDARQLVDKLYRAVLSRPATVAEKNAGRAYLQASESATEGLQDMFWALVCAPEFQYIK